MPPNKYSRYQFSRARPDSAGRRYLEPREPVRYRELAGNKTYVVKSGDTPDSIATLAYTDSFPNPERLWWVLLDFQPTPIHDPTVSLSPGTEIIIPPASFLRDVVFSRRRR